MKQFKQFHAARLAILVYAMALTACTGLSSRTPLPERAGDHASDASPTVAQRQVWQIACSDGDDASLGSNPKSCMAMPSRWNESERAASGYFYGIECCGRNRGALTPVPQAPAVSSPARTASTSEVLRADLMQAVFQFATQP
jgi:hypothetical protein